MNEKTAIQYIRVPEDVNSEASLIATIFAPENRDYAELHAQDLNPEDFIHPLHGQCWRSLRNILESGGELNVLGLNKDFERRNISHIYPFTTLVELLASDDVGSPSILIANIKEASTRRKLQRLANNLLNRAGDMTEDLDTVVQEVMHAASSLNGEIQDTDDFTGMNIMTDYVDKHVPMSPLTHKIGELGLESVDDVVEIPVAEPMVIGARPGCGKTAMGIQLVLESLRRRREVVPYFISLELTKPKLLARIAAYLTGTDSRDWRNGLYGRHAEKLFKDYPILEGLHMTCPRQGTPWPKLEAKIRRKVAKEGVNLVVIDYFGYIGRPKVGQGSNVAYAFGEVMDGITGLCKELNIAVVVLCQLKQPTDGIGKRPNEGQFADSDRPYRDSNVVLMLYKDANGETHLYNPKNRDGVPGKEWDLKFDGASGRFSCPVRETKENPYQEWK